MVSSKIELWGSRDMVSSKTYTIRMVIQEEDLDVLKKALEAYPKKKYITEDLLGIIKYQERKQNENS